MPAKQPVHTPVTKTNQPATDVPSRISKLKLAFMYVLIGGLAASALVAITALLIGSFSSEIQKSLATIFIFFTHSPFILALLWSDKNNQVGKTALPTTLFVLALANTITTTLSTWEIISSESAWRALGLYILIIGAAYVIAGLMQLFINHKATKIGLYASIGSVSVLIASLVPWVLYIVDDSGRFDPFYFRIVAALAILSTTIFIITVILRGIALARQPELTLTKPVSQPIPQGLLAIYITVGVITAMVWWSGLAGFVITGIQSSQPVYEGSGYYDRYY